MEEKITNFHLLGLMSGSSLDGADLACCRFEIKREATNNPIQSWSLEAAETIPLPRTWQKLLQELPMQNAAAFCKADAALGRHFGRIVRDFLESRSLQVDAIASHGHTIFHFPEVGATAQIGDGAAIAAEAGLKVIDNFRAMDLALGGQGAPLAPIADKYLFPEFDFWLNLGGIANISGRLNDDIVAFDIGGANQIFNALVSPLELPYDEDGRLAAQGKLIPELLQVVDALPYFELPYPKSLGNDWVRQKLLPLYLNWEAPLEDKLHTAVWQLARQIANAIRQILEKSTHRKTTYRLMASGGGAFNSFLTQCIKQECEKVCSLSVVIPETRIIQFKEAILMALMGALRLANLPNCLSSVTGARRNAVGGSVHQFNEE